VLGIAGLGWFLLVPHAEAKAMTDHVSGKYSVVAAPGLGYQYRWDADGDGKWDSDEYGTTEQIGFDLKYDETRKVRLEVKNAFGRISSGELVVARPKIDAEQPTTIEVERGPDGQLRGVMPGGQRLPGAQPGQPGQPMPGMPPRGLPGMPGMRQPGMPGQPGMQPGQPGMQPGQPGQPGAPGMPPGLRVQPLQPRAPAAPGGQPAPGHDEHGGH
jgi:hypothetical protein